ncbi:TAXI family TRAP transporter solute-binding subunit [Roseovarius sp. MMSF_3281]|uniref:TAXI family TRAP transporter solute-binding subunit n=1 Tax=Roseovarius sp. MMSF_3281 TaxID=3046694 RepID=UPI00273D75BE|nr:TAXI family TRAP transporter solute-binding subunit [Roseovarius sp. MMSF_3281]
MRHFIKMTAAAALAAGPAFAQEAELPRSMLWATYDVGSSGYAEASAIADAFGKEYGTRVRIMPSGTSIGRLLPLKTGRVQYGWLANELYFATEALFDFSAREWGPQDLRVVAGRPSTFGMAVAGDAGIEALSDIAGKRVPRIKANPSINIKVEALLAFGGLTWDDVEVVEVPSYGAALKALVDGQVDVAGSTPTASTLYEMESSSRGLDWAPMPKDNADGWEAIISVASFFAPATATQGAGITEEDPAQIFAVRYPMITVYADADADEIYNFTKALDETYDIYANATKATARWKLSEAGVTPADAPFHPGAIRYLEEIGVWTEKDAAWNEARLDRLNAVTEAWDAAVEAALDEGVSDKDWPAYWSEYSAEALN